MADVWLILCAAAAMLTAYPALRRLDAYIEARLEREASEAGNVQSAEAGGARDGAREEESNG